MDMEDVRVKDEPIQGGHDCHFLEEPPSDLICPICRLVARDPHQVSCCGKIYCKTCFLELESRSRWMFRCANCREEEPSPFPDRKTAGQVNALRVACSQRDDGCVWRGALRDYPSHAGRCEYADINCPFSTIGCRSRPLRKDSHAHMETSLHTHLDLAVRRISELEDQVRSDHSNQTTRLTETVESVKTIVQNHKKDLRKQLDKRMQSQETSVENRILGMKNEIVSEAHSLPVVFKLSDFSDLQDDDDEWHSPAFYTHAGGYRMCLRVYTNGCSDVRGTHLSCYVYLKKSDNDPQLSWPFRGAIHIQVLNQLQDDQHHSEKITFSAQDHKNYNSRVSPTRSSDMGVTGLGKSKFVSLEDLGPSPSLNRQYLKDDCLYFRVSDVEVHSIKPWLASISGRGDD